ncbi:MAG: hypothetical protein M0Z46_12350 [Actinomycetota bacterium]|jgi:hypothetical protein|nr:hypothetical protein [Actinomycetota bacterium]
MSARTNGRPITRTDVEAAFQRVAGDGEKAVQAAMPTAFVVAGAGALLLAALAYLFGKRRGRRKSSVIEIRRL